jgi:hypothetical protein
MQRKKVRGEKTEKYQTGTGMCCKRKVEAKQIFNNYRKYLV